MHRVRVPQRAPVGLTPAQLGHLVVHGGHHLGDLVLQHVDRVARLGRVAGERVPIAHVDDEGRTRVEVLREVARERERLLAPGQPAVGPEPRRKEALELSRRGGRLAVTALFEVAV